MTTIVFKKEPKLVVAKAIKRQFIEIQMVKIKRVPILISGMFYNFAPIQFVLP